MKVLTAASLYEADQPQRRRPQFSAWDHHPMIGFQSRAKQTEDDGHHGADSIVPL